MKTALLLTLIALSIPAARAQDRELVRVNGTPVLQSEVVARLLRRHGDAVVDEMVNELLLRQAAKADKIKAEPAEIDRRLSRIKQNFPDQETFERQLKQSGMTIELLKQELEDQIIQEKAIVTRHKISVEETDLKKAFAERKDELSRPPAVHLRHILVKTEAEAKAIAAQVKEGADFAKIAKEKSLAPTGRINGGDYGFVAKGMLPPEIERVAFSMKKNELRLTSDKAGSHVFQVLETRPGVPAEFGKVKDDLRELLLAERIKAALPEYLRDLRKKADIKPLAGG